MATDYATRQRLPHRPTGCFNQDWAGLDYLGERPGVIKALREPAVIILLTLFSPGDWEFGVEMFLAFSRNRGPVGLPHMRPEVRIHGVRIAGVRRELWRTIPSSRPA